MPSFITPKSFVSTSEHDLGGLFFVYTDIDDTLTDQGKLKAITYSKLWELQNHGIQVIPVTGRPAGWCEMIIRQWPVKAVIGENGGFYFTMTPHGPKKIYQQDSKERTENRRKIKALWKQIKLHVPRSRLSSDQYIRQLDLAIDICEDIQPRLTTDEIQQILDIAKFHGAHAKVSSIHINLWFGDFDKEAGVSSYINRELKLPHKEALEKSIFIGDSPNDEPMFKLFPKSCAVANIQDFLSTLQYPPQWITSSKGGLGFVEFSDHILKIKA